MVLNLLNLYSLIFALFDKISSMTIELENFQNISCMKSTSDIYNATTAPYDIVSTTPLIRQLRSIMEEAVTDLGVPNTTSYNLFTNQYFDNSSIFNITDSLYFNLSFFNKSFFNETLGNFTDYDTADIKDFILDYLTDILFNNNDTNFDFFNTTEADSVNISTTGYTNEDRLEAFKTTMAPLLVNISETTIEPLLMNISNNYNSEASQDVTTAIYNEISSTVSSYQNSTTCQPPTTLLPNSTNELSRTPEIIMGNYTMCARLRSLCWETMFGQELIKLTVMDLIMTILSTLAMDFFRGIFVRVMNRCWCWDLEKKFPQYGDFKVAENILHLVNNQGMVWMGMFFSPGLVVLNVIKLYILMYFRAWAVLTCNVPHEVIFRASRSNNFYYALLLMMLFLCVLPVGYAVVWIKPSWHCGPFSKYRRIFNIFTQSIKNTVPESFQKALDYIASPGIVIPLLVLLVLIIYYLVSLTGALREANEDLKIQLRRERTEERRKMFQIADRRRGGSGESNELSNTPFAKWKKLLGTFPSGKSFEDTSKQQSDDKPQPQKEEKVENKGKDLLSKFIKKALRKSSTSEEEQNAGDGTDTEQHDSLPYDPVASKHKPVKPSLSWNSDFQSVVSRAAKANQRNTPRASVDSDDTKPVFSQRHDAFELKNKFAERVMPSTSKDMRQDSASSVWSDNIPVITISKTESAENILMDANTNTHDILKTGSTKFKPKIKCALKKQSTEFDEDTICHFNKEFEKNLKDNSIIKSVSEEDVERLPADSGSSEDKNAQSGEKLSDHSSSEDTEFKEISIGTILNFPIKNEKLFSSEEKDISDDSIEHLS